jgi:hypothetical protein
MEELPLENYWLGYFDKQPVTVVTTANTVSVVKATTAAAASRSRSRSVVAESRTTLNLNQIWN